MSRVKLSTLRHIDFRKFAPQPFAEQFGRVEDDEALPAPEESDE